MSSIFAKILEGVTAIRERIGDGTPGTEPEAAQVVPLHGYEAFTEANTDNWFVRLDPYNQYANIYAPRLPSGEYQEQKGAALFDIANDFTAKHMEAWQTFKTHEDNIYSVDMCLRVLGPKTLLTPLLYPANATTSTFAVTLTSGTVSVNGGGGLGRFAGAVSGQAIVLYAVSGGATNDGWAGPYVIDVIAPGGDTCTVKRPVSGVPPNFPAGPASANCAILSNAGFGSLFKTWEYWDRTGWLWGGLVTGAVNADGNGAGLVLGPTNSGNGTAFGFDVGNCEVKLISKPLTSPLADWTNFQTLLVRAHSVAGAASSYVGLKFVVYDGTNNADVNLSFDKTTNEAYVDLSALKKEGSPGDLNLSTIVWFGFYVNLTANGASVVVDQVSLLKEPGSALMEIWDLGTVAPGATFTKGVGNYALVPDGFDTSDVDLGDGGLKNYVTEIPLRNGINTYTASNLFQGIYNRGLVNSAVGPQRRGKLDKTGGDHYYAIRLRGDPSMFPTNVPASPTTISQVWVLGHVDDGINGADTTYANGNFYYMLDGATGVLTRYDDGSNHRAQALFRVYCTDEVLLKNLFSASMSSDNPIGSMVFVMGPDIESGVIPPPSDRRKELTQFSLFSAPFSQLAAVAALAPPRTQEYGDELKTKPVIVPKGGYLGFEPGVFSSMGNDSLQQQGIYIKVSMQFTTRQTYR